MRKMIYITFVVILFVTLTTLVYIAPRITKDENDWTDSSWTYYFGF